VKGPQCNVHATATLDAAHTDDHEKRDGERGGVDITRCIDGRLPT
jgi:hypothetical protein